MVITINGEKVKWGVCQNCTLSGFVRKKYVVGPGAVNANTDVPEISVCVTCYDAPTGILSDNQTHKRLAEKEYLDK